jgi:hypothetical protein
MVVVVAYFNVRIFLKFGAKVRKSREKRGEKEKCLSLQHKEKRGLRGCAVLLNFPATKSATLLPNTDCKDTTFKDICKFGFKFYTIMLNIF